MNYEAKACLAKCCEPTRHHCYSIFFNRQEWGCKQQNLSQIGFRSYFRAWGGALQAQVLFRVSLWVQQGSAWAGGAFETVCKDFCDANLWQTPPGKYSDKLSGSYLEFKRLKNQLWEKRGIFLKMETLKGLGGVFSQLLLGDSCCSAIFFFCLVLMSSGGGFGVVLL